MKVVPNILIVDDDPIDREVYKRLLRQNPDVKCNIYEAASGAEGIEYCHAKIPDCILLDYAIPDIDGLAFIEKIANNAGELNIPVVMLTGLGNEKVAVQAIKKGVGEYLVKKDVTGKTLWEAIKNSISAPQHEGENKVATSSSNPGVPADTWIRI